MTLPFYCFCNMIAYKYYLCMPMHYLWWGHFNGGFQRATLLLQNEKRVVKLDKGLWLRLILPIDWKIYFHSI